MWPLREFSICKKSTRLICFHASKLFFHFSSNNMKCHSLKCQCHSLKCLFHQKSLQNFTEQSRLFSLQCSHILLKTDDSYLFKEKSKKKVCWKLKMKINSDALGAEMRTIFLNLNDLNSICNFYIQANKVLPKVSFNL